jgi:HJR/Mrr/RecB family endonuclease
MKDFSIHYKILAFGKAGADIIQTLKAQEFPVERLFYFDTDRNDFGKVILNNKFLIGEALTDGRGTLGAVSTGREVIIQDMDLFDRLTNEECLYILVGGLGGGTFTGFAGVLVGSLAERGMRFIFITTLPDDDEERSRRANAIEALKEINHYSDKVLLISHAHKTNIFQDKGKQEGYGHIDNQIATIIDRLLSNSEPSVIKSISKATEKMEDVISRIRAFVQNNELFVSQQDSKMVLANTHKALLDAIYLRADYVHTISPRKFEELVAYIYTRAGYTTELTPSTRDHGVDIKVWSLPAIVGNPFLTVVQAKQKRKNKVGEGDIRDLIGTKSIQKAEKAALVTTTDFSKDAIVTAKDQRIDLIRFYELTDAMKDLVKE